MVRKYIEQYEPHEREIDLGTLDVGSCQWVGIADGMLADGVLLEDKFKAQWTATDAEALKLDDQLLGYVHSTARILGCRPSDVAVEYRVTRRPSLRQKKDETDVQFLERIEADVDARPDHYFVIESPTFTDDAVSEWWDDTCSVAASIQYSNTSGSWPKNRAACKSYGGMCQYWGICSARDKIEMEAVVQDRFKVRESE